MACTIAHELAHILNLDTFNNSLRLNEAAKDLDDEERKELSALFRRESEINADLFAQKMVLKAGYKTNTCIEDMEYAMRIKAVPKANKFDTHPTYPERVSALQKELKTQLDEIPKEEPESTKLRWKYDRDLNLLKFIPY